eukprot:8181602-Pyramimonas_sp.AAC.1
MACARVSLRRDLPRRATCVAEPPQKGGAEQPLGEALRQRGALAARLGTARASRRERRSTTAC